MAPAALASSAIFALYASQPDLALIPRVGMFVATGSTLLLALGAWDPRRYRWALRGFAGVVALSCLAYLADEGIAAGSSAAGLGSSRSEPSLLNAVLAALAFGVPAAGFALTGAFRWWIGHDADVDSEPEFDVDADMLSP